MMIMGCLPCKLVCRSTLGLVSVLMLLMTRASLGRQVGLTIPFLSHVFRNLNDFCLGDHSAPGQCFRVEVVITLSG